MSLSSRRIIFSFQKNSSPCSREKQTLKGGLLLCLVSRFDISSEDRIISPREMIGAVIAAGSVMTGWS